MRYQYEIKERQILKSILILTLVIMSIGNIALAFINPEAYFFGNKLGGMPAVLYLTINSIVSGAIIFLFLSGKKLPIVLVLSLLYFIYNIIESIMTSLILFHEFQFPTILIFGFLITIIFLTVRD